MRGLQGENPPQFHDSPIPITGPAQVTIRTPYESLVLQYKAKTQFMIDAMEKTSTSTFVIAPNDSPPFPTPGIKGRTITTGSIELPDSFFPRYIPRSIQSIQQVVSPSPPIFDLWTGGVAHPEVNRLGCRGKSKLIRDKTVAYKKP